MPAGSIHVSLPLRLLALLPALLFGQTVPPGEVLLEGEIITGITISGSGELGKQSMTSFKDGSWSSNAQAWWTRGRAGDVMTVPFTVTKAGAYQISLGMTKSYNYGSFTFGLDGKALPGEPLDLFSAIVTNTPEHTVGTHSLTAGEHKLTVHLTGKSEQSKGTMFGLDFIRLRPVVQASAAQERITVILTAHEQSLKTQVHAPYESQVLALNQKYSAALARAMQVATQAAKLEEAVALRTEKQRVDAAQPLPASDEDAAPALKPLRSTYRTTLAQIEAARDQAAAPLILASDRLLEALQLDFTQKGDLEAAVAVRSARAGLKTLAPSAPAAAPAIPAVAPSTLITSPPPEPKRPASTELTLENLSGRRFAFGMERDRRVRPYSIVRFGTDGRIHSSESSNETSWSIDPAKGHVQIISSKGVISTLCDKVKWKDGLLNLSGEYQLGKGKPAVIHIFDEIAPVPIAEAGLTPRRIGGRRFEFCYITPDSRGNEHIVQLADDGRVLGGKFNSALTWKIEEQGRLIFLDPDKQVFTLFDRSYTFNGGEHLVLEGPNQKTADLTHRLFELQ